MLCQRDATHGEAKWRVEVVMDAENKVNQTKCVCDSCYSYIRAHMVIVRAVPIDTVKIQVKSITAWFPTRTLYVVDTSGGRHTIHLDTQIKAEMLDLDDKPIEKDFQAREIAPFLSRGYIVDSIEYVTTI